MTITNSGYHCHLCGQYVGPFSIDHRCSSYPPWPGQPIRGLEEHEVRRIVREEIQKALYERDLEELRKKVRDPWNPPV